MSDAGPARVRRAPAVVAVAAVGLTLGLLPVAGQRLGATTSFVPAMLAVVACFDVLSVYLLVGDYLDNGDRRLLAMAWAYLWSLVSMAGYALAFPGVFPHPPLATTPSVAPALYIAWHAGFPALLGAAWAPWPRRIRTTVARAHRLRECLLSCAAAVGGTGLLVTACARAGRHLPVLISGLDTRPMAIVTGPVALPLVGLALLATRRGSRGRSGPERWTSVTVLVCLCDLALTYSSRYRFSLGWYCGRALTLTGSGLVLMAMLAGFRTLKSAAVLQAATDPLTGLANRRRLEAALAEELSRCRRSGRTLTVVSLDLDGFKAVNDRYGHAAGDALLRLTAQVWGGELRGTDLLARVGGDEFVVLLPETDERLARLVLDRLVAATPSEVGVSVGLVTGSGDADATALLAAADAGMYAVKRNGRPVPGPRLPSEPSYAG